MAREFVPPGELCWVPSTDDELERSVVVVHGPAIVEPGPHPDDVGLWNHAGLIRLAFSVRLGAQPILDGHQVHDQHSLREA